MIQVGIIGSAGYTAGELIRILLQHPEAEINFAYSTSNAGKPVNSIHQDLIGETSLHFTDRINTEVDVVFLCLGHGNSSIFLENNSFASHTKVIDLSNDFRLEKDSVFRNMNFTYGLPEYFKDKIVHSKYLANPGCFATAIQLALLPLADSGNLYNDIHIQAVTGSTGAGTSLSATTHFTWRNNNFSYYKPFVHQHLGEIIQNMSYASKKTLDSFYFMPYRGNFSRGIYATLYTQFAGSIEDAHTLYSSYFKSAPFVHISTTPIHLKQVVNTNKCVLHLHKHENTLLITSCIDNLIKGASGQAVQNMNLMFGFDETTGLKLKGTFF